MALERRLRIAGWFCQLAGVTDRRHRALVVRWVTRWQQRAELAVDIELGCVDLGGEGG